MPWGNEQRYRRAKVVKHTTEPNRYRISSSVAALHYESRIDSGHFDTEVDMRPERIDAAQLNGWRVETSGWHFAYQGFDAVQQQSPIGTLGYGGRRGQHWFTMRPFRIGYMHWPTRDLQLSALGPTFSTPVLESHQSTIGIDDADPSTWSLYAGFTATISGLWTTPGGGSVDWVIKGLGGALKQDIRINQAAREWIEANQPPATPASETWFGLIFEIDWTDIPQVLRDGSEIRSSGDFVAADNLELHDAADRILGRFGLDDMYVPNRGGRVDCAKRFYEQGGRWYMLVGANVQQMQQNLLPGDLVIDPPIGEETITTNTDDATQDGALMRLSGYGPNNLLFIGGGGSYHIGWRFQTVPIPQGATVNSATVEPVQGSYDSGTNWSSQLHAQDADDTTTFTTANNNITLRPRTAAFTTLNQSMSVSTGFRHSLDVRAQVQEVVNRGGWQNNNNLTFPWIGTTGGGYLSFEDYAGGAADAANFNADITTGGTTVEVDISEPVDFTDTQAPTTAALDDISEPVDFTDTQAPTTAAVDDISATVDFADSLTAITSVQAAMAAAVTLTDNQAAIANVSAALSAPVDFDELMAVTAIALESLAASVDLGSDFLTGGVIPVAIAESVELTSAFSYLTAVQANLEAGIDLGAAYDTTVLALDDISANVELLDDPAAVYQHYVSISEGLSLAATFTGISGTIAGAVQLLAESRNRGISVDPQPAIKSTSRRRYVPVRRDR